MLVRLSSAQFVDAKMLIRKEGECKVVSMVVDVPAGGGTMRRYRRPKWWRVES
jgi:hypothetical protein